LVAGSLSCGGDSNGPTVTLVASVIINAPPKNIAVGSSVQFSAVALDQYGRSLSGVTFAWSSSNQTIATVSSTGVVTGVAAGSATITVVSGTVFDSVEITVGTVMTTELSEQLIARG
jgi:uncharacterized protein YjdB